ncbi:MAG: hypothetical protein GY772_13580 [bacterium]|nr:hypothetical protein [bacterium]
MQRGRGDANLSIGAANDPFADQGFEAKRLTPAEYASLEDSVLVGVGSAAPKVSGSGGEASGSSSSTASQGASTWKRRIEPRHRRAVSTFFDQ